MLNGNVDDKKEVKYDVSPKERMDSKLVQSKQVGIFQEKHDVKKPSQSSQMSKQKIKKELTFRLTSFQESLLSTVLLARRLTCKAKKQN